MIIKEPPKTRDGKSDVGRLIRYIETAQKSKGQVSDDERVLCSGAINMACDEMTAEMRLARIAEMKLWARQNRYCKAPIHHRILSFREGENPTEAQCREAVQIFLETCGLEECQCVWAVHKDTHCTHIHVCVNRIHPIDKHAVHVEYSKTKEQIAARKIEVVQGWPLEKTGTLAKVVEKKDERGNTYFDVVATTIKERREKNDVNTVISQAAKEHEYRTGEKSTERIIKERAADVLYAATKKGSKRTWADVHAQLAELGMEIKPWRSGGVVVADGVSVTCSKIGRQLSWGNLIKALGEYREREPRLEIRTVKKEIIAANDDDRKRKEEYSAARRKYYADKSAAYDKFNAWRISAPKRLKEDHRQRRKELKESRSSWRGYGSKLNALLHQLSARYAQEIAEYRAERDRRRKRLKELYGKKWPTYQGWLRGEWDEPSAMIIGSAVHVEIKPAAIALYTSQIYVSGKKSSVVYRDEQRRVAFVDRGNFISVNSWRTDPQAILASLQLAEAKWGKFRLNGCDEYKQKALALAVEHGFTVTNTELQEHIKELQAAKAARETEEQKRLKLEQLPAAVQQSLVKYREYVNYAQARNDKANREITAVKNDSQKEIQQIQAELDKLWEAAKRYAVEKVLNEEDIKVEEMRRSHKSYLTIFGTPKRGYEGSASVTKQYLKEAEEDREKLRHKLLVEHEFPYQVEAEARMYAFKQDRYESLSEKFKELESARDKNIASLQSEINARELKKQKLWNEFVNDVRHWMQTLSEDEWHDLIGKDKTLIPELQCIMTEKSPSMVNVGPIVHNGNDTVWQLVEGQLVQYPRANLQMNEKYRSSIDAGEDVRISRDGKFWLMLPASYQKWKALEGKRTAEEKRQRAQERGNKAYEHLSSQTEPQRKSRARSSADDMPM